MVLAIYFYQASITSIPVLFLFTTTTGFKFNTKELGTEAAKHERFILQRLFLMFNRTFAFYKIIMLVCIAIVCLSSTN